MASLFLLNIVAGVCLLLWGLSLLRLGMSYGFGQKMRSFLSAATENRGKAFGAGLAITTLLQSSTATVLIVASFVAQKMVGQTAGLAMVLGADVGTTLVSQVFAFDLSFLMPLLLIAGFILFKIKKTKNIGRILLGAAFMLLALSLIRQASVPLQNSVLLPQFLSVLASDPFFALLLGALVTALAHSSLAIVLLVFSFAQADVLPVSLALYMVLGANLGGTLPPLLATLKDKPEALRIPTGNVIIRGIGVAAVFFVIPAILPYLDRFESDPARQIVHFHTGFNLLLAIVFLPLIHPIIELAKKIVPDRLSEEEENAARYLNVRDLGTPSAALAGATRETLRMADIALSMLRESKEVFSTNNSVQLEKVRDQDDVLDDLYMQIKNYMARLSQEFMTEKEAARYVQVLTFSTNLEHVGDVIDKNLMPLALKKIKRQTSFSPQGEKEIAHIQDLVLESMDLAQSIFVNSDPKLAKRLLENKKILREAELSAMATHIERLSERVPETIDSSSLHVDIIRDYRRINSYLCSLAYPLVGSRKHIHDSFIRRQNKS